MVVNKMERHRDEDYDLREDIPLPLRKIDHKAVIEETGNPLAFTGLVKRADPPTIFLDDYYDEDAAEIQVPASLAPTPLPPGFKWGMLANNRIGDCVIAMMMHSVMTFHLVNGTPIPIFVDQDAIRDYSAITGYNPADPSSDQGTDEGQALAYWMRKGLVCSADGSVHKILGRVGIRNPKNRAMRHLAIYEFDAVQYAFELPVAWQGKDAWTGVPEPNDPNTAPGSWGGHGICARAYDASGREDIETWGADMPADGNSVDAYCAQASIVIAKEMINAKTGVSRTGIHWDDMWADFKRQPSYPVE